MRPPPPPRFPHRRAEPEPWAPMTDAEWALLSAQLNRSRGPGRPPTDLRRTWDAIFWVACSRGPWRAMPVAIGRPDSAHRALRRAAQSGVLARLMVMVSDHLLGRVEGLRWRICRAVRRAARLLPMPVLLMAERLGLADALPCHRDDLPKPHLSETLLFHSRFLGIKSLYPTLIPLLRHLLRSARGNRRAWRLTA